MTPKHHSHDEQPDDDFGCCGGHGHDCCDDKDDGCCDDHDGCCDEAPHSVRARQLEVLERVLNRKVREGQFASAEEGMRHFEALLAEKDLEEVLASLDLTPEEKSLLLVAKVGLAESDEEAAQLLDEALAIDPNNLDAQVLRLSGQPTEEEVRRLREIVRGAEEQLGKEYFDVRRGKFFADPETRPYMRARHAFAVALAATKDFPAAIAEAEGMLELCPQDHLGVRDYLAGYYLASDQPEKALQLMDERYGADDGAVFQYARMMAHYRLGDENAAEEALSAAIEANAFVYPVLLGMLNPDEFAEDMTPGTPGEALYVIGTLYDAMLRNESAMEWGAAHWVERMKALQKHERESDDQPF